MRGVSPGTMKSPARSAGGWSALFVKVGADGCFGLGRVDSRGLACFHTSEYPCHIGTHGAHNLQAFGILLHLLRAGPVHHGPVLTADEGHAEILRNLIQHLQTRCCAAAAGRYNGGGGLIQKLLSCADGQSVHEANHIGRRRGIVDGCAEDHAVGAVQLPGNHVHAVIKDALACLLAAAAADAAAEALAAHVDDFGFNALGIQCAGDLFQCTVGAARCLGAAVQKQYFHRNTSFPFAFMIAPGFPNCKWDINFLLTHHVPKTRFIFCRFLEFTVFA